MMFLQKGYSVTAVDSDAVALAELERRAPSIERHRLCCHVHDLEDGTPLCLGQRFAAVIVVNYLHRPLLHSLVDLLEPGGILIFEAWAQGNEVFARAKDPSVLQHRSLRPNELLHLVLPRCEVLAFSHGSLEDYEGRDCAKQMLCARLPIDAEVAPAPADGSVVSAAGGPGERSVRADHDPETAARNPS